jgi:hypothetical protein
MAHLPQEDHRIQVCGLRLARPEAGWITRGVLSRLMGVCPPELWPFW